MPFSLCCLVKSIVKTAFVDLLECDYRHARIEATNNKIKLTIRMAYGFRNLDNLISMIILRYGGLAVDLPGRAA